MKNKRASRNRDARFVCGRIVLRVCSLYCTTRLMVAECDVAPLVPVMVTG
ncbi:MAG: hypothetical protein HY046_13320 [Acidobacteria bacterium]|nr:hypothetical protein [Acidobacteriota bacterium]